jgi:gamma-glutamyltranspeptidase
VTFERKPGWPWLNLKEPAPELSGFRPVLSDKGMVSSPHASASRIGASILSQGGNAVDAAIATSAALMVVLPMQCGPGGDAFWLVSPPDGTVHGLDASGRSSHRTRAEDLADAGLDGIPSRSAFAVSVPGAVDGWVKANARFGRLPLGQLLEPAATLAEEGFFASRHTVGSYLAADPMLREAGTYALWPELENGLSLYQRIRQPDVATTLRDIGRSAGRSFYEGENARRIAAVVQERGGWLTVEDLAAHSADWVDPISNIYRDQRIFTMPPPTQGFAFLAALAFIECVAPKGLDWRDPMTGHILVEAVAAGLGERDDRSGDPSQFEGEPSESWSDTRLDARLADYDGTRRSTTAAARTRRSVKGDTAHFCVVDGDGMSVSMIQSVYYDFGSCIPVVGSGYPLQNRAAAFHLDASMAGHLAPGVRPPSTLMPVLAQRDGKLSYVFGCMGGDGQLQINAQLVVNLIDGGLDPQQAISRPRFILDRAPESGARLMLEAGLDDGAGHVLRTLGHDVVRLGPSEELMGHAQVIQRLNGVLVGGSDPRSDGQVAGL